MCERLSRLQRELFLGYIRRLSACCDSTSRIESGEAVMDLVGRFLRRLLQRLSAEEVSHVTPDNTTAAPEDAVGAFDLVGQATWIC